MAASEAEDLIRKCSGHGLGSVYYHKDGSVTAEDICVSPDSRSMGTYENGFEGMSTKTESFTIHYSKRGAHIAPAAPSWEAKRDARRD